jgi:hypothetical protein
MFAKSDFLRPARNALTDRAIDFAIGDSVLLHPSQAQQDLEYLAIVGHRRHALATALARPVTAAALAVRSTLAFVTGGAIKQARTSHQRAASRSPAADIGFAAAWRPACRRV